MLEFYVFKYSLYSIIYCGIAITGILNGKIIETICLFISFVALRYCFPKTFHSNNVYHCVFWSIAIFVIGVPNTSNIGTSIFSSILIGCAMTLVLYFVQDYVELKTKAERTVHTLSKDELIAYIDNSLLSAEEKSAIQFHLIDKLKGSQFYDAMGYSKSQCLRIYKSAINKINILIGQ
jgi:hypothetical protein